MATESDMRWLATSDTIGGPKCSPCSSLTSSNQHCSSQHIIVGGEASMAPGQTAQEDASRATEVNRAPSQTQQRIAGPTCSPDTTITN
jgi:hypothetical protein